MQSVRQCGRQSHILMMFSTRISSLSVAVQTTGVFLLELSLICISNDWPRGVVSRLACCPVLPAAGVADRTLSVILHTTIVH